MTTNKITPEELWSRQQISSLDVDYDLWNERRTSIQAFSQMNQSCIFTVDVFKDSCRFSLSIETVNFLTGDLSGSSLLFGLAQLRAVILISFSSYPVFLCWNNAHESLIVVGYYCGGD